MPLKGDQPARESPPREQTARPRRARGVPAVAMATAKAGLLVRPLLGALLLERLLRYLLRQLLRLLRTLHRRLRPLNDSA